MFPAKRRNRFKFTEKKHSLRGIIATGLSIVSLVSFAVIIKLSFNSAGTLSAYFGSAGIFCVFISVIAFGISIVSLGEEDSFPLFKRISLISSVLAVLCWVGTLVEGII